MYLILWQYTVSPDFPAIFERAYGAEGQWVGLFQKSAGYAGTELLRDRKDPSRYVTIDRWESANAYNAFRSDYRDEYRTLDEFCDQFTLEEKLIGSFETLG